MGWNEIAFEINEISEESIINPQLVTSFLLGWAPAERNLVPILMPRSVCKRRSNALHCRKETRPVLAVSQAFYASVLTRRGQERMTCLDESILYPGTLIVKKSMEYTG